MVQDYSWFEAFTESLRIVPKDKEGITLTLILFSYFRL